MRIPGHGVEGPAAGTIPCKVHRAVEGQGWERDTDRVMVEEPLEIRIETRSIAVLMRTPGHDEELAAGFLLSEGILRERSGLKAIRAHPRNRAGNVVDVFLADGQVPDIARFTRHVFASSSCGLCGIATVEAVRRQFPRVRSRSRVTARLLQALPDRVRAAQAGFAATGGTHAAAWFDAEGRLRILREDVGRHSAVDKVIGRLFLDQALPVEGGVLWVSGRVSFEMVQKALAAGMPILAAVGAPTSLAIELARESGQTLVGFLRGGRFNVYSRPRRIQRTASVNGLRAEA